MKQKIKKLIILISVIIKLGLVFKVVFTERWKSEEKITLRTTGLKVFSLRLICRFIWQHKMKTKAQVRNTIEHKLFYNSITKSLEIRTKRRKNFQIINENAHNDPRKVKNVNLFSLQQRSTTAFFTTLLLLLIFKLSNDY